MLEVSSIPRMQRLLFNFCCCCHRTSSLWVCFHIIVCWRKGFKPSLVLLEYKNKTKRRQNTHGTARIGLLRNKQEKDSQSTMTEDAVLVHDNALDRMNCSFWAGSGWVGARWCSADLCGLWAFGLACATCCLSNGVALMLIYHLLIGQRSTIFFLAISCCRGSGI